MSIPVELTKMLVALLVMIDPPGAAPMFLAITERHAKHRTKIAFAGSLTAFTVLMASGFFGQHILDMFGISISSFRVIGGILFLAMAIDMLNARSSRAKKTPEEETEAASRKEMSIVPIGIPLLAGPGAISSVLIYMSESENPQEKAAVVGVIGIACTVTFVMLALAALIAPRIGQTGINILKRLMGLVLGALAIEFIVGGLGEMLPGLAGGAGL
jgi:multiple antibiotic resistance protein